MLRMKLSRITLKMSDFEEWEQLKQDKEKRMETDSSPLPPAVPTPQKELLAFDPPKIVTGDPHSSNVPRSSTPEPQ